MDMEQLSEQPESTYDEVFHVVIEGNTSVGKTNLLSRYVADEFTTELKPTTGFSAIKSLFNIDGKTILTTLWEVPGNDETNTGAYFYYQDIVGVLLVYDVNCRRSFVDVKNKLRSIRDILYQDTVIVLVGNKIDRDQREVPEEEARFFADSNAINFFETSALEGKTVKDIFHSMFTEIYRLNKFYKIIETIKDEDTIII